MVTAVADIKNFEAHVRRELALDAKVERLTISQLQGSRINRNLREYARRRIGARVYLGDDTGVIGCAVRISPIEATRRVRSQLWSKTIWNALEKRHSHGIVDQPESGGNTGFGSQQIDKTHR